MQANPVRTSCAVLKIPLRSGRAYFIAHEKDVSPYNLFSLFHFCSSGRLPNLKEPPVIGAYSSSRYTIQP